MRQSILFFVAVALVLMASMPGRAQKVSVGKMAPDFAVPSLDGKTSYRLSDFLGRRVLIFNWASW
ncbi:MAG TPA: hypothetical protein VMO17_02020 [Terriglobia bacterium]|nr:hypothetical protein [Terriglobia bacterium]